MSGTYGCHNRPPFRGTLNVQSGWFEKSGGFSRAPLMKDIEFKMSTDCQYTNTDLGKSDARCTGCKWRKDARQCPPPSTP